jgi:hypothetical protein
MFPAVGCSVTSRRLVVGSVAWCRRSPGVWRLVLARSQEQP